MEEEMAAPATPESGVEYTCDWDTPDNPSFHQWTTVNVAEVIPGVALPLNATWFQAIEKPEMRKFVAGFGAEDLVPVYDEPYPNFIGFFAGRPALNMGFVMTLLSTYQVDAGSTAAEQFFTPDEGTTYAVPAAADPERARRNRARTFRVWGQLPRVVAADRARAEQIERNIRALDLSAMAPAAMWRNLDHISTTCAVMGANHLLASYAGSEYSSLLMQLLAGSLADVPADTVVRLTSALDVESSAASVALWELSRWVRKDARLREAVIESPLAEVDAALAGGRDERWRALASRFRALIAEHGFHGRNEISLTVADWSEDHTFLLNSLKTMVSADDTRSPVAHHEQAVAARRALEDEFRGRLPAAKQRSFDYLLERAQTFVRMRETTKTTLIRALRPGRPLLLEVARWLVDEGAFATTEDLYYLLYHEVEQLLTGGLDRSGIPALVARRREQHETLQAYRLPDNFAGLPDVRPIGSGEEDGAGAGQVLTGLGVSGGVATGTARVIMDLDDADTTPFRPGDVLVAPLTDAPWTPLFLTASAVVVETGGLLSHAATVAREFGIPAVAMVHNATRAIKDGQVLTVDGHAGTVRVE
jgi:pyruvate,water dikinase